MKEMKKVKKSLKDCKTDEDRADFLEPNSGFDLLDAGELKEENTEDVYRKKKRMDRQINLLMETKILEKLKKIALKKGIPYQTLVRMWLVEKILEEAI